MKNCSLPDHIAPLVKLQVTKIFNHHNEDSAAKEDVLTSRLAELNKKLKSLKIRHELGEVDKETYDLTFNHLNDEMLTVTKEMNTLSPKISNLDKLLTSAMATLSKLSQIWDSSNLEGKRKMQKTLFPDGIFYDVKNHEYLTKKTNSFIYLTDYLSRIFKEGDIKKSRHLGGMSIGCSPCWT